jgi:ribA/ribD-fused uncharacterized protein
VETVSSIEAFTDNYRWLSNFWPCKVCLDGQEFPSIEHAYQAAKWPPAERHRFLHIRTGDAKRLGKHAVLPPDWEAKKIDVMRGLIQQKFAFRSKLGVLLARTGNWQLIEGNTWGDTFWGVCNGVGENWLGKLLMEQRKVLRQQYQQRYQQQQRDKRRETVPTAVRQEQEADEADHGGLQAQVRELP